VTYKITVKIHEKNLSTEAIGQAVGYVSRALESMHIAHTIECHKDRIVLSRMSRPPTIIDY
jgi:hypothetical protein